MTTTDTFEPRGASPTAALLDELLVGSPHGASAFNRPTQKRPVVNLLARSGTANGRFSRQSSSWVASMGAFTPTAAATVGVLYALIVGMFIHRELKVGELHEVILGSMKTTATICFIIAAAAAFGWLVAFERIPAELASIILSISDNPIVTLLVLNVSFLVIGAVMDNIAAMIILGSVLTSIGAQLGLDPIHLGAIVVINFAIGMATPPFGYSLFVGAAISGLTIERIAVAIWPLLVLQVLVLLSITFTPALTLTLPSLIR